MDTTTTTTTATTTTMGARRFLAVLEGMRARGLSHRQFCEACALDTLLELGREFLLGYAIQRVVENGDDLDVLDEVVGLITSAYTRSLFPDEGREHMINEGLVHSLHAAAEALVKTLRAEHQQQKHGSVHVDDTNAPNTHAAAFRRLFAKRLGDYTDAREAWACADAPHAVCRLKETLVNAGHRTTPDAPNDSAAVLQLKWQLNAAWRALVEARGQAAAVVWLKQTWNTRQAIRTKLALKRAKAVFVQMQLAWGDEMRADLDQMERFVEALRANLRRFLQREVVDDEDAPDRFRVHVPSLLPAEQAFADAFFCGEDDQDDEAAAADVF